jgi:hypothetical protein
MDPERNARRAEKRLGMTDSSNSRCGLLCRALGLLLGD